MLNLKGLRLAAGLAKRKVAQEARISRTTLDKAEEDPLTVSDAKLVAILKAIRDKSKYDSIKNQVDTALASITSSEASLREDEILIANIYAFKYFLTERFHHINKNCDHVTVQSASIALDEIKIIIESYLPKLEKLGLELEQEYERAQPKRDIDFASRC